MLARAVVIQLGTRSRGKDHQARLHRRVAVATRWMCCHGVVSFCQAPFWFRLPHLSFGNRRQDDRTQF